MAVTIDGVGEINGVVLPTTSFGKILQVVRATDTTERSTTSTSFVDVTGMSVTITPQRNTSAILLLATGQMDINASASGHRAQLQITDSSNNAISGAQDSIYGALFQQVWLQTGFIMVGYATPATTSATTYKVRFRATASFTIKMLNNVQTGQMYAIEVSA